MSQFKLGSIFSQTFYLSILKQLTLESIASLIFFFFDTFDSLFADCDLNLFSSKPVMKGFKTKIEQYQSQIRWFDIFLYLFFQNKCIFGFKILLIKKLSIFFLPFTNTEILEKKRSWNKIDELKNTRSHSQTYSQFVVRWKIGELLSKWILILM